MAQRMHHKLMHRFPAPKSSTMSDPQGADLAARLTAITALPEADGLDELAQILAGTDLVLSDVAKVLGAVVRACHAAANEGGRAVVRATLDLPFRSDLDAKIAMAIADLLHPLAQRH